MNSPLFYLLRQSKKHRYLSYIQWQSDVIIQHSGEFPLTAGFWLYELLSHTKSLALWAELTPDGYLSGLYHILPLLPVDL